MKNLVIIYTILIISLSKPSEPILLPCISITCSKIVDIPCARATVPPVPMLQSGRSSLFRLEQYSNPSARAATPSEFKLL